MTQRTLFPILLVGLPIGLALSVVAALYLYYNPLDIPLPSRPKRADAASLLRRSPNENDLRDYRRILTSDLALVAPADPTRRRAVANWIASTLGPSNLGLTVRTVEREPTGPNDTDAAQAAPSMIVEVTGTRQKNDAILVVTGYHADTPELDGAVSTSALMTVAGAFAGTPQRRTLVFGFLGSEQAGPQTEAPLDALVQSLKLRDFTVRGILDLRVGAATTTANAAATSRGRVLALAPREGMAWTGEAREAFAPRKPDGFMIDFVDATAAPPAAAGLAGWRAAPAPYLLLHITPASANDEATPLQLARTLEGVLQALANQ